MNLINHPFVLACISGILLTCSWPTYGFPVLLFVAFIPLLLAEKTLRKQNSYAGLKLISFAYVTFLIWNTLTTGWLYYASLFGVLFAVLVNSLLMSLLVLLYHFVAKRSSQTLSLLFFITLWISFEKLHLHWEFSWPWLNLGNGFSEYITWIQWYEYTGMFGGSLWILTVNTLIFSALEAYKKNAQIPYKKALVILSVVLLPILFSVWQYHSYQSNGAKKEVIVLQPNVDPYTEKYNTTNADVISGLLAQTNALITPTTNYVITPETVLTEMASLDKFPYSSGKFLLSRYIEQYPNISFLVGIDTHSIIFDKSKTNPASNYVEENVWVNFYNAALYVDSTNLIQHYYKSKLVVGVENLPYKSALEPLLGKYMINLGGTISTKTTQADRVNFKTKDGVNIAPVICYESVYGEYVTGYVKNNANFLAILTNDAWWNETQGHKQHLSLARLRAIETRRDIARSANTGISAFINQTGDITKKTKYNQKTALIGTVTLNSEQTFYVKYGDYIARIAIFMMVVLFVLSFFTKNEFKIQTNG